MFGDAPPIEDVSDLADRHHREAGVFDEVHVGLFRRTYAIVVAVLVLPLFGVRDWESTPLYPPHAPIPFVLLFFGKKKSMTSCPPILMHLSISAATCCTRRTH